MTKKTLIGTVVFVIAMLILLGSAFLYADPQDMYKHFPQDAGMRLEQMHILQSILETVGYGLGALGLVFLAVGLLEKRLEQRTPS